MNKKLVAIILTGALISAALVPATAFAGTSKKIAPSLPIVVNGWPSGQPQPHNPPTPGIVYALGGKVR